MPTRCMRPGTGVRPAAARTASASGTPSARSAADHRQQVGDVVVTDQRAAHRQPVRRPRTARRPGRRRRRRCRRARSRAGPCVRAGPQHRAGRRAAPAASAGAVRVVEVEHRGLSPGQAEQRALGRPVRLHRAVVVEVVVREVGEQRHLDARAGQAMLLQADRRGLDRAGREALVDDAAQRLRAASPRRAWSWPRAGQALDAGGSPMPSVPTTPQRWPSGRQRLRRPPRGRGLAVGAGGGDHPQPFGGMVENRRRRSLRWRP